MAKNTTHAVVAELVATARERYHDKPYLLKSVLRFVKKVKLKSNGCLVWTAKVERSGYGRFWLNGRMEVAHRFSYIVFKGDIQDGYTIDHLCHTAGIKKCRGGWTCHHRRCVNPEHLEALPLRENLLRSVHNIVTQHHMKTHCHRGHEFTEENIRVTNGGRACRACDRINAVAYYRRKTGSTAEYKPRYGVRQYNRDDR